MAIKAGKADVVTDHIERIDAGGSSSSPASASIAMCIVTATGLTLTVGGKIAISVDGKPALFNERYYYKGCMYSNLAQPRAGRSATSTPLGRCAPISIPISSAACSIT